MSRARALGSLLAAALLASQSTGCALLSKATPLAPRYFSPAPSEDSERRAPASSLELRMGRVTAAAQLEQRMAFRTGENELGYYDSWRWTEPPEMYLERALARELFEQRGLVRAVSGLTPVLDVELLGFEELRGGSTRARVQLRFTLRDERRVWLERSQRFEQGVAPGPEEAAPVRLASALAAALTQAVTNVGDLVLRELEARRAEGSRRAVPAE